MRTEYYKQKLKEGLCYEDLVEAFIKNELGIDVDVLKTRDEQEEIGESRFGLEIKYDGRFSDTGNLYIETAEKSRPDNPEYVASGIRREDNTWLWAMGDYETLFLFLKRDLMDAEPDCRFVETPTSRGFLLSSRMADELALFKWEL